MKNWFSTASAASRAVFAIWAFALVAIFIRVGIAHQHSVYPNYELAANFWRHGIPLYQENKQTPNGFVYSPLVAAFFVPLALLPDLAGEVLWRLLSVAVCMAAIRRWLETAGRRFLEPRQEALFYLLLLPLFLGNINNGQANILLIGLLVWAVVGAYSGTQKALADAKGAASGAWWLSALCVALATYLKVYPLVAGLLLLLVYPGKFGLRFFVSLAGLFLLSLVLQHPAYVQDQYQMWISTRLNEDRHLFSQESLPHDLFLLLNYLHLRVNESGYVVVRLVSGALVAAMCLRGRLRKWPEGYQLNQLLALSCTWLLLCGPASESSTYVLMAPSVLLELFYCFSARVAPWRRVWMGLVALCYFGSFTIKTLLPLRDPGWMCLQPGSALLFLCYLAARTWPDETEFRDEDKPRGKIREEKEECLAGSGPGIH